MDTIGSLRGRMGLLFAAIFLLVSISVASSTWTIDSQKQDGQIINLAGRQRMLIQQMTKDALLIEEDQDGSHAQNLQEAARSFDQTLQMLFDHNKTAHLSGFQINLPATQRSDILTSLVQVSQTWTTFRSHLDTLTTADRNHPEFKPAMRAVQSLAPTLVQQADGVVKNYETALAAKLARLGWIQLLFFVSALALLALGAWVIQRSVVQPLQVLGRVAERIGGGDLSTPVAVTGPREIALLAHSFDTMRAQLKTSQEALLAWAQELEARVAHRTQELAALYEVSREISSRLDLNYILGSVTGKARGLLDGEVAFFCLLDDEGQALNLQAVSGPRDAVCERRALTQHPMVDRVLTRDRALLCGAGSCAESCQIIAAPFRVSHLVAPLRVGERAIGALCVGNSRAGAFSNEAGSLLTKLANSAAIALENARLYAQAERVATLEERQRIAAEMHDGLAQALSYLGLKTEQVAQKVEAGQSTEALQELLRIRTAIDQTSSEVRRSITRLQASPQPRQALQDQLAEIVEEFAGADGPSIDLILTCQDPLLLQPGENEQVLRVIREALLNARRHAHAGHIVVRLAQRGSEAIVTVEDDGRGFDPKAPPLSGGTHFGLSIMRARAARIGGRCTIQSTLGQGTQVSLNWPINHRQSALEKDI